MIERSQTMVDGINLILRSYVALRDVTALLKMRAHRQELLSMCTDTTEFSFAHIQEAIHQDIAKIESSLNEVLMEEDLRGHIDVISADAIAGWAQYIRYPEIPVAVRIL